jgi:hypothetical protein
MWCAPVDWDLFDRLHADDFEDCSAAGPAEVVVGREVLSVSRAAGHTLNTDSV